MGCSCRLMVALVLLFALPTQGHEACYNDSWTYHRHTHSCFRLYRLSKTWREARAYCSEIQLGSTYGVNTRLAKIDDKTTDDFIKTDVFPTPGWIIWIGLHSNTEKNKFRWDGYPNETPKYKATHWETPSLPYVSSYIDGWRGRNHTTTYHPVCQHQAKKIGIVTCEQHEVQADGLKITCTSERSPVRAGCQWTYKYDGDSYYRAWRSVDSSSHQAHTENSAGKNSYTTTCSVTFPNVNNGTLMFKMKMYPVISGLDVSTNEEALTTGRLNIVVVVPDVPVFKVLDNTIQTSSPIHFHENDSINISCEVRSGNPPAHSVTLSCEFPFNDSDEDNKHTVSGSTYVIDEMASRDMDGNKCTCIGNHLTGPIESPPLTFNVTYPAKVKTFTVNKSTSSIVVNMDETLTLSCMANGNPLPSVNIRQLEPSYVDTSTWQSDKLGRKLKKKIVARCAHNGRYTCSASNIYKENNGEVTIYVDIRVRCPPTYCNKMSGDLKLAVKPFQTVFLCVLAYPMPAFKLLKNSKAGWNTTEDLSGQINNVTKFESQQNVTINFSALGPSHLGQYALDYSEGSSVTSSRLYFQLTAPLTPCGEDENLVQEVTIGQSVSINMCVTAYPKPSKLVMQIEHNEFGWRDYDNANITMVDDFDTLTEVTVDFPEVKATDLGKYRLYDPQDAKGPHLTLSLSEARSGGSAGVSGAIVGAVVSIIIVIIIVVVIVIFIVRRRRNRDKQNENLDSNKDSDTATYNNQEDVSVKRKRAKTGVEVPIYDNDGYAFEHRCNKDSDDEKETVDTERPYSNMDVQNNTPDIKESDSNTAKEEDDLVYIKLDFNCTTDKKAKTQKKSKPQSKSKKAKAEKEQKEKEQEQEQTEYAAISATATIKIKMEKENDKNKEKDGDDEEDVYEKTKAEDNVP